MEKLSENIDDFLAKEIDPAFARRAKIILENLDLQSGMRILEVGCGRGFYEAAIAKIYPEVKIVGVDLNDKYLSVARNFTRSPNVKFLKADATKLPFKNREFDRIICTEVLEHIKNDENVISEIHRVLKPKGTAIITVPHKNYPFFWDPLNWFLERLFNTHVPSNIWWLAGIWADHIRLYAEDDLTEKFKRSGFAIDSLWRSTRYCLPFSHFLLYGIGKNIIEMGLSSSFNRFSYQKSRSRLVVLVKSIFNSLDQYNERVTILKNNSYLNIVIKVRK